MSTIPEDLPAAAVDELVVMAHAEQPWEHVTIVDELPEDYAGDAYHGINRERHRG